jgi:hypothetical protein
VHASSYTDTQVKHGPVARDKDKDETQWAGAVKLCSQTAQALLSVGAGSQPPRCLSLAYLSLSLSA